MTDNKNCIYNTSKSDSFDGYCNHPMYHTDRGWKLITCPVNVECPNYTDTPHEEKVVEEFRNLSEVKITTDAEIYYHIHGEYPNPKEEEED